MSVGVDVDIPDPDDITPQVGIFGFDGVQPYKLVLIGEKSSLNEVLAPAASSHKADLYLPTGEPSDTMLHQMARVGADDGRPMRVLYFSDADPSGWQMPISVARKLQGFKTPTPAPAPRQASDHQHRTRRVLRRHLRHPRRPDRRCSVSTFDVTQAERYLDLVIGDQPGAVCLRYGRDPHRTAEGKYKHRDPDPTAERAFVWPDDEDALLVDVIDEMTAGPSDVWICPAVRAYSATPVTVGGRTLVPSPPKRRKGGARPPQRLWADLDGPAKDPALLAKLDPFRVCSGSPGNQHVYVRLAASVPLAVHQVLNERLAKLLGGDAKWSDESLLRLPGTLNHKTDPPGRVEWLDGGGTVWTVDELAALLGVDLGGQAAGTSTGSGAATDSEPLPSPEPLPDPLPGPVLLVLSKPSTGDRSADAARVIEACAFAGLTPGEALSVLADHPSYAHYKSGRLAAVDVDRVYRKFGPTGQPGGHKIPRDDVPPPVVRMPILPEEFWQARRVHGHIRRAAHSRLASADLVLHAVLAKIAGMRSHELHLDSGRGKSSLNYFVAAVAPSGIGKTTSAAVVDDLLPPPGYLNRPTVANTDAAAFHDGIPLGSGEGIAEAYMGVLETPVDKEDNGKAVTKRARGMVRHNVWIVVDEGETFTRMGERSGATTSATLRSAWVGATIGQANGRDETTRIVKHGTYSLGLLVGFQPTTALPLLSDTATGTAQRFAWVSANDHTIPDEPVEYPGALAVPALLDEPFQNSSRTGAVTFPAEIVGKLRREHLAKVRGEVVVAEQDSQGPLMRCKMAALLALLDGRTAVDDEDWRLAGVMWSTSCDVRDAVVAIGQADQARDAEQKAEQKVRIAERTAAAVGTLDAKLARLAQTLAEHVVDAGGLLRAAARKTMASRDRQLYDSVVEHAESLGLLRQTADGGLLPPKVDD